MTNVKFQHVTVFLVALFALGATFPAAAYVQPAKSIGAQRTARIAQLKIRRAARNQRIRHALQPKLSNWLEKNDFSWYTFRKNGRISKQGFRNIRGWFNRNFKRTFAARRNPSATDWRGFYRYMVARSVIAKPPRPGNQTGSTLTNGTGNEPTPIATPIPAALILFASGIAGVFGMSRKRTGTNSVPT